MHNRRLIVALLASLTAGLLQFPVDLGPPGSSPWLRPGRVAAVLGTVAQAAETLAAGERPDAKLTVRQESNVKVPMRDGVHLATDLYFLARDGQLPRKKVPAVLLRTPYGKGGFAAQAKLFAGHGYLVAIQDCRGRFNSEGEFYPFRDDPQDGHDTIVWLTRHPGCNGKVGMYGCSYMAWVQFHAATQNSPGLAAMVPWEGPTNAYHYSLRTGGALHLGLLQWIIQEASRGTEARRDPTAASALAAMAACPKYLEWCANIPWQRGQTPLAKTPHYEDAAFQLYFEHPDYTDFWRQPGFAMDEYFDRFPEMPILWVCGWFDWYPRTISDGYQAMVRRGRKDQYLLIGPWTHHNFRSTCGDVNFGDGGRPGRSQSELPLGPESTEARSKLQVDDGGRPGRSHVGWDSVPTRSGRSPNLQEFAPECSKPPAIDAEPPVRSYDEFLQREVRWFDRWLKGDRSVDLGPPVKVFVMGGGDGRKAANGHLNHGGRWYCGATWPPGGTRNTEFFLHADRALRREKPTLEQSADTYVYDPRNTVSSNGRCIVAFAPGTAGFTGMGPRDQVELPTLPGHGVPGRRIADRPDVLVFRTPPLAESMTVAGDIKAVLWVSSDVPDTDFFVKLIDEYPATADYPQGFGFPVSEGILRARYRDGFERPCLMETGRVYRIEIPLEPSANLFQAGHRLRLDLYSSSFPNFDINPNTGDPHDRRPRIARNTIHHDARHASLISLPVCPASALGIAN